MTWIADNAPPLTLATVFAILIAYGAIRSIIAEVKDRARDREADCLRREVESVPVHGADNGR